MQLNTHTLQQTLLDIFAQLTAQPIYSWGSDNPVYAVDSDGQPAVKVTVANCGLDFDPWQNLRNPALVGLHPIGFQQLWQYYAANTTTNTDDQGRSTVFQIPQTYESAARRFNRVVIVSVMLPISHHIARQYSTLIRNNNPAPLGGYKQAVDTLNSLLEQAVTRAAYRLMDQHRTVLAMTKHTVAAVTDQTVPACHQGTAHGPCKSVNFPHKSMAVLTGLGQFGAHRLVMVDEITGGKPQRFLGPLTTIVIFDPEPPSEGPGLRHLTDTWCNRITAIHSGQDNSQRFCGYYRDGNGRCTSCIDACPEGAILNSVPAPDYSYPEQITRQVHRFWQGELQFDFQSCTETRNKLAKVHGEWICGRCLAICLTEGIKNPTAVSEFHRWGQ